MPIPFLQRRPRIDDPFAAEGTNWADKIVDILISLVFWLICFPGFLMLLGFSIYFIYGGRLKPWMRWAWPVWGGLCAVIGGILIVFIIAICFIPCSARHNRRAAARRQRREELLRSNGVLAPLPGAVGAAPPPAEAICGQEDLEAQTWANTTAAALQSVAQAQAPPAAELPTGPGEDRMDAYSVANSSSRPAESNNDGVPRLEEPDLVTAEKPVDVVKKSGSDNEDVKT